MDLETRLIDAAKYGDTPAIERVLRRVELGGKLDLKAKDSNGDTALHLVAAQGFKRAIQLLLAAGVEVNLINNRGLTPLDMAWANGHSEVSDLLREHGATRTRGIVTQEATEGFIMKCPYCGEDMKEETERIKVMISHYCDGGSVRRHDRINLSSLDNKFRTVNADIAKELEGKGYHVRFDSKGNLFEIAQKHAKVIETSQQVQETKIGSCDVCNRQIEEPEGYLLTTREVVTSSQFWAAHLGILLKLCTASRVHQNLPIVVARMASSDTPWMVCAKCSQFFSFDRSERREKARTWRSTGQPEGGFSLCSIRQNGNEYSIDSKDDDALMTANLAAAAVLSSLQGDEAQGVVLLIGWRRRVEQLSAKKDVKNIEDRIA